MIQRPGKKQITDSTSAAKWKYFGEIEASIVIMSIIAVCISIRYIMIHYKVIGSSLPVRVGCIKIV